MIVWVISATITIRDTPTDFEETRHRNSSTDFTTIERIRITPITGLMPQSYRLGGSYDREKEFLNGIELASGCQRIKLAVTELHHH
jgi:hypothetical protein